MGGRARRGQTGRDPLVSVAVRGFAGDVIDAVHPSYEEARTVFNALIDKRPATILRPRSIQDVEAAVRFAVDSGKEIAVRGGGHSVAGHSMSEGGIVIDLSSLRGVAVDAEARVAVVEGGATWRDVDRATGRHRLATPGGVVSTTGVGGFTLGGGIGWLARTHGLTCDNLLWAELVLPSGEVVRAAEDENADVLWALRGGGGNFGVVQRFAFALHSVDCVTGGIASYRAEHAESVLAHYATAMDAAGDDVAAILDFATADDGTEGDLVTILACSTRTNDDGAEAVRRVLDIKGAGAPVVSVQRSLRYPLWQQIVDHTAPPGRLQLLEVGLPSRRHGGGHRAAKCCGS